MTQPVSILKATPGRRHVSTRTIFVWLFSFPFSDITDFSYKNCLLQNSLFLKVAEWPLKMKMCVNGLKDVKRYSMKNAISFRISGKLKKAKSSIHKNSNSRKAVLQKLKTPPKTITQSSDKIAKLSSDKVLNKSREKWEKNDMSILKVRVQFVIAAEVKKES